MAKRKSPTGSGTEASPPITFIEGLRRRIGTEVGRPFGEVERSVGMVQPSEDEGVREACAGQGRGSLDEAGLSCGIVGLVV